MITFTNIVFKRFIGELNAARLTKDDNILKAATAQYEKSNAAALSPALVLNPASPTASPTAASSLQVPEPAASSLQVPVSFSYGGAKTRKYRAKPKRNKKTRRH